MGAVSDGGVSPGRVPQEVLRPVSALAARVRLGWAAQRRAGPVVNWLPGPLRMARSRPVEGRRTSSDALTFATRGETVPPPLGGDNRYLVGAVVQ